jgi:hypothetical protein
MRSFTLGLILISAFFHGTQAQNSPTNDLPAVSLATQSIAAIAGRSSISDVTLTGNVTLNKHESGAFKLAATINGESRMDLALSASTTTVIRNARNGIPVGKWTAGDGRAGSLPLHNCWTDAAWFFPPLGSLAGGPNVVLTYVGKELRKGNVVHHLHSYIKQGAQSSVLGSKQLSAMDFYLDGTTFFPLATTFYAHPDKDARKNLLIEVEFLDYKQMNGIEVPMHIQTFQQGSLTLDLVVASASINSGLPQSSFSIK